MSKTTNKFAPEVRDRVIRVVLDHGRDYPSRWATVVSSPQSVRGAAGQ
jgi:transposase